MRNNIIVALIFSLFSFSTKVPAAVFSTGADGVIKETRGISSTSSGDIPGTFNHGGWQWRIPNWEAVATAVAKERFVGIQADNAATRTFCLANIDLIINRLPQDQGSGRPNGCEGQTRIPGEVIQAYSVYRHAVKEALQESPRGFYDLHKPDFVRAVCNLPRKAKQDVLDWTDVPLFIKEVVRIVKQPAPRANTDTWYQHTSTIDATKVFFDRLVDKAATAAVLLGVLSDFEKTFDKGKVCSK